MKKVLALTLSAVLAMGAATTAFAADPTFKVDTMDLFLSVDENEDYNFGTNYDSSVDVSDEDKMEWGTEYDFTIMTGAMTDPIYIYLDEDGEIVGASDGKTYQDVEKTLKNGTDEQKFESREELKADDAEALFDLIDAGKASLKVTTSYGKEYLETIKVDEQVDEFHLLITTTDSLSTKDGEFGFTLTLSDKSSTGKFADRELKIKDIKIGNNVGKAEELGDSMNIKEDGTIIDTDEMEATEDFEFTWGDNEIARFIVDLDDNDGKKNLSYTTAPVDALIEANPEANMNFFTLKAAPRFNKIGEFTLFCDGDIFKYIYEVDKDGQLKEVNATYDEDEEGFVFTTRTLGSYVVSDVELVGAAIDEEVPGESDTTEVPGESETTTDDGRENPETGANDMVNVAAAMAVVSLAAAGAVAFKKSSK